MRRTQMIIDHQIELGRYEIKIHIPDDVVPYGLMKSKLLGGRGFGLSALDFARELLEKEAYWHSCPEWELDYGICVDTVKTSPLAGNGDKY
jgi:hypothetical protein